MTRLGQGARAVAAAMAIAGCTSPQVVILASVPALYEPTYAGRSQRPTRPQITESIEFDIDQLPQPSSVAIAPTVLWKEGEQADRSFTRAFIDGHSYFYVPEGFQVPGPIEPTFGEYIYQLCGEYGVVHKEASWESITRRSTEALDVAHYEGSFSGVPCAATPEKGWRVHAKALLPGVLYAFRRRLAPDLTELHVVGPSGVWTGASDDATVLTANSPFSHASLILKRGSAHTILWDTTEAEANDFIAPRRARAPEDGVDLAAPVHAAAPHSLSIGVEIVWPEGDARPSALAYVADIQASPGLIVPPPQPTYYFEDGGLEGYIVE